MKILLLEFDLFKSAGGGQAVYQKIVENRPEDKFYYFIKHENSESERPPNIHPIPFRQIYHGFYNELPAEMGHFYSVFTNCQNLAASVASVLGNFHFDVVDTPDYQQYGLFIKQSLVNHGITADRVALALHGAISNSLSTNWPAGDISRLIAETRLREHLQFRTADVRYALSEMYSKQWQRRAPLPVNRLDPLCLADGLSLNWDNEDRVVPNIYFIGRREKQKGPDIFVDLVWNVERDAYNQTFLVGGDGPNFKGEGSDKIIHYATKLRDIEVTIIPGARRNDLKAIYDNSNVVVLPSRRDTFNLVALEALLHGCPVVISNRAGIVPFLRDRLPAVPVEVVDLSCARAGAGTITRVLKGYSSYRQRLMNALQNSRLEPDLDSVSSIYERANTVDLKAQSVVNNIANRFALFHRPRPLSSMQALKYRLIAKAARIVTRDKKPSPLLAMLAKLRSAYRHYKTHGLIGAAKTVLAQTVIRRYGRNAPRLAFQLHFLFRSNSYRGELLGHRERSSKDVDAKVKLLCTLMDNRFIDRIRLFSELIRLERKRGNDLVAATYCLRLMRWQGADQFGQLPFVVDTLNKSGYVKEALVAEAMFGREDQCFQKCCEILDQQFALNRGRPSLALEFVDDRREKQPFRATIIVSMYNAARKLPTFIEILKQQTMLRDGTAEVIFVDSGSPSDEYKIFQQAMENIPFPAAYARSPRRETIQAAWNRGILLSQSDFLTFLGVDEGIHPQCLEHLVKELEIDPDIDWVMSNSIVTAVDRKGVFDHDVMRYDRSCYKQDWHYLDCTYVNYVGCLYRKSIHERFGYYDEKFTAAGDTEFKNRVLPFIRSRSVNKTLGVFNNFPEERTTQHPRAELEDLRAWYLHRTIAGVNYAFRNAETSRLTTLLGDTLRYRKCYCTHWSTDLDLALSLVGYLRNQLDAQEYAWLENDIKLIMSLYRNFELLDARRRQGRLLFSALTSIRRIKNLAKKHQTLLRLDYLPAFEVFNDNRYEQHWWPWRIGNIVPRDS